MPEAVAPLPPPELTHHVLHRPYEELEDGQVPLEVIETEITELAGHIHAANARLLKLVAEFDARRGWADWGCRSAAHWLMWRCGYAPGAARERVRVARRLADMPKITEAFSRGELSFSQVRALSRVANPENEDDLLMWARHGTTAQIERMVRGYRSVKRIEELDRFRVAHAARYLRHHIEPDGSVVIRARLSPDEGAVVLKALELADSALEDVSAETSEAQLEDDILKEAGDPLAAAVTNDDDRDALARLRELEDATPTGRRAADALVMMAETLLESGPQARSGVDRTTVAVHVALDALITDGGDVSEIEGVGAIPPEAARMLSCDSSVVALYERGGQVIGSGPRKRTLKSAIRRALEARDRCCRFPGCTNTRFVDAHHIQHWAHGGDHKLANLILLCRFHHRFVHGHGYTITRDTDNAFVFVRPDGTVVDVSAERPTGPGVVERNIEAGLDITPATCVTEWCGDSMNYDDAISHLLFTDQNVSAETFPGSEDGEGESRTREPAWNPLELGEWGI